MSKKFYFIIAVSVSFGGLFFYNISSASTGLQGDDLDLEQSSIFIFGDIRIQLLSDTLLRVEQRTPEGYEDRLTFTVVDRYWPGTVYRKTTFGDRTEVSTANYTVIAQYAQGVVAELQVKTADGFLIYDYGHTKGEVSYLPGPGDNTESWIMSDSPRLIPPVWGATPAPLDTQNKPASGWDIQGEVHDDYVFIIKKGDYKQFQKDFVKLTGSTPLPPIYAFGLWNSRYHAYTEDSALQTIEKYRQKHIPLDVFVLDTDWRTGAAVGYEINTDFFPNLHNFTKKVHDNDVFIVMNDHPEAVGDTATEAKELQYRYDNLTRLLEMGVDAWWYDRNWHAHLKVPLPGMSEDVWGMRLYHDITERFRPQQRPLILANVDGINHGKDDKPSHPAAHRFPIWWTGDTKSEWAYLQSGITNAVRSGIFRFMPYVSEDIGGHHGIPTEEFYLRSVQYGVFSPVLRLHSSGKTRYPWDFGSNAEEIATEYIRLRYRLLPLIYSAARQNYENGMPLLRRCDLYWPEYPQAVDDQQYLFGDDLLVAPVNDGKGFHQIPDQLLHTPDNQVGVQGEYFDNIKLEGKATLVRVDTNIDFNWGEGKGSAPAEGVPSDFFSIRWLALLGPVPQSGLYKLGLIADDGVRLWVNEKKVIDFWRDQGASLRTGTVYLEKDQLYSLRVEYYDRQYRASCKLVWWNLDDQTPQIRNLWIPPGDWQDLWTGEEFTGPLSVTLESPLWHIPLFVRNGGIVLSIPQGQSTHQRPWSVVIADAFVVPSDDSTKRILYEDDGGTTAYQSNKYRKTSVTMHSTSTDVALRIGKSEGTFADNLEERSWIIRLHFPAAYTPEAVAIDGEIIPVSNSSEVLTGNSATLLLPSKLEKRSIFFGRGEQPPAKAGSVLEIFLQNRKIDKDALIEVSYSNRDT